MGEADEIAEKMLASSTTLFFTSETRAAMRCGLGDAAHLCDAIARDIENQWRGRGGYIKKRGQELANQVRQCGDAIWAMREKIEVPNG